MPRLEVVGRDYAQERDWPRGTTFADMPIGELEAAVKDRKRAMLTIQPGIAEDMCRHALERLEEEIKRRAG
jgi:hypothetical protein